MKNENEYSHFLQNLREELAFGLGEKPGQISFQGGKVMIEKHFGEGVSQVIQADSRALYMEYKKSRDIKALAEYVIGQADHWCTEQSMGDLKQIRSYENIRSRLFVRALNYTNYKESLKNIIYEKIGDIALVLYIIIQHNSSGFSAMKVNQAFLRDWKLSWAEAMRDAFLCTYQMNPPVIYQLFGGDRTVKEGGEYFMAATGNFILRQGYEGNYLTNKNKREGGTAVFYPGVAQKLAALFQDDFYVVFPSIHEAVLHNKKGIPNAAKLERVLDGINQQNRREDILSNHVYLYSRSNQCFQTIST